MIFIVHMKENIAFEVLDNLITFIGSLIFIILV